MEELLELDEAALSKEDEVGRTPLHWLMWKGDAEVATDDIEKILAIDEDAFERMTP